MAVVNWRDVLASAGLGERDWRRVLMDARVELNPIAFHGERTTTGIVKFWRNAQGHGVIAADETASKCATTAFRKSRFYTSRSRSGRCRIPPHPKKRPDPISRPHVENRLPAPTTQ